jgi:predicted PurR-regulated permease PerM
VCPEPQATENTRHDEDEAMTTRTVVRVVLAALLTTLAVLLVLWLLYRLQTVVVWSILALFLTIGLEPAVDWLAVRRVPRALAILAVYAGLVVILAGILAVAVPALVQQGSTLVRRLQDLGGLGAAAESMAAPFGLDATVHTVRPQLDQLPAQLAGSVGSLADVTAGTVGSITALLTVAVLAFFFLYDGAGFVDAGVRLLPPGRQPQARRMLEESAGAISGYIRGNLAISAIAGLSALVGMLVLGIPYAVPLAIVLAVIDLVPMVGVTLGAVPVVLAALTVSPLKAVILLAYIIVYQQIESNVLNPLIYGRSDRLSPLTVFLAFLVGSLLFGIIGALIAIPAANIIRIVLREWQASHTPAVVPPTAGTTDA